MKKFLFLMVIAALLAGCSLPALPVVKTPEQSDADMATRVAQILTAQPTPTAAVAQTTETGKEAPTQAPATAQPTTESAATAAPTVVAEATTAPTAVPPTAEPSAEPTAVPPTSEPTATSAPTATLVPGDPRASLGTPSLTDKLDNSDYWPTGEDTYTAVSFRDGMMLLSALTDSDGWRLMTYGPLTNFYYEVTARFETCSGSDHFGIFARVPEKMPANRGYLVGINCAGQYRFAEWDGTVKPNGLWKTHIYWTTNSAILAGANQTNRIGLLAEGSKLTLYVNGVKMDELTDATFGSGYIGLFIGADNTNNLTVQVDEVNVWAK